MNSNEKATLHAIEALGVMDEIKHDAGGATMHLLNELRVVQSKTYDVLYTPRKWRQFVPVQTGVDPGAESVIYRQWDMWGMAKTIHHMADDLPLVGVTAKEFSAKIESVGVAYDYTIQDLRRSALTRSDLPTRKARAAREAVESFLEVAAVTGGPNMTGLANNPNVPLVVLPSLGAWDLGGLTADQLLENLSIPFNTINTNTKGIFDADTLLLPPRAYNYVKTKKIGVDSGGETVLTLFQKQNPGVTVERWERLAGAGASGKDRAIAYKRDPDVVSFVVPVEFESFPPQPKNLSFYVPCHARVGGVEFHYPLAATYFDIALT